MWIPITHPSTPVIMRWVMTVLGGTWLVAILGDSNPNSNDRGLRKLGWVFLLLTLWPLKVSQRGHGDVKMTGPRRPSYFVIAEPVRVVRVDIRTDKPVIWRHFRGVPFLFSSLVATRIVPALPAICVNDNATTAVICRCR